MFQPTLSRSLRLLVAAALAVALAGGADDASAQSCFGDCNGNGSLTASDIGRINGTILRCGPCPGGVAGGVAAGCAALANGCAAADFNADGCIRASELGRATQNILRFPPSGCSTSLFTIGTAQGQPGAEVAVSISLTKNGRDAVTIAPLVFDFDPARLTFTGCTALTAGKAAFTGSPATGRGSVVVIDAVIDEDGTPPATPPAGLTVFPDGPVLSCSFAIAGNAPAGATPITFVSAGLADLQFNDFSAVGTNGSVTVQ